MLCPRLLPMLGFVLAAAAAGADVGTGPRREDRGDLIVLHLQGSYEEMGRQQAALMAPELRATFAYQRDEFARGVRKGGVGVKLLDWVGIPLLSLVGPLRDESGFLDEAGGTGEGLGLPRREILRSMFSLASGSTVFVATGSATADGKALLGRNVDWDDGLGSRRPLVIHYRPDGGDLAYVSCGWPLVGLPTVGLNEAGLAISLNYFITSPQVSYGPAHWPHRRALQTARNVDEAIEAITGALPMGIAGYFALADAAGAIALVECTPDACAVFRPEGDWFAHANHARTADMIPHDLYRSPDSFARQAAMEAAVRRRLGRLTPESAAEILRDRTGTPFANSDSVGNLAVLNAAVVQPAAGILWHATSMQPHAPFGAYVPFSPARDVSAVRELAADPAFARGDLAHEAQVVAEARRAIHRARDEAFGDAAAALAALSESGRDVLDPDRLALARARVLDEDGKDAEVYELLGKRSPGAPFDTRAWGPALQAAAADRLDRRAEAARLYRETLSLLDTAPEYASYFAALRRAAEEGTEGPVELHPPSAWYFLRVPY